MPHPVYYYTGSPYPANIPLPPSPYGSPYGVSVALPPSPVGYAVSVPLPPSPAMRSTSLGTPVYNPLPLPPSPVVTPANLAAGTTFTAHPMLTFDAQDPSLKWDVRLPLATARINERPFPLLSRRHLSEHAVSPPWTFVRLRSALLPWLLEVTNPSGVTVGDVLNAVYTCMRHGVEKDEWRDQSSDFQSRLLDAWRLRCDLLGNKEGRHKREREEDRGVRRVDWLLYDVEWLGLERSKSELETWDMHFRSL